LNKCGFFKIDNYDKLQQLISSGEFDSRIAKDVATEFIERFPSHQRFHNDRLWVSKMFGLDSNLQRSAALGVFDNGWQGYYEPITGYGFDLNTFLIDQGVSSDDLPEYENVHPDYNIVFREFGLAVNRIFDLGYTESAVDACYIPNLFDAMAYPHNFDSSWVIGSRD
jgi:hypothetical protein